MNLLDNLTPRDLLMAGFLAGVWWSDRRAKQRGERVGAVEDRVAKVEGKLEAANGRGPDGK